MIEEKIKLKMFKKLRENNEIDRKKAGFKI